MKWCISSEIEYYLLGHHHSFVSRIHPIKQTNINSTSEETVIWFRGCKAGINNCLEFLWTNTIFNLDKLSNIIKILTRRKSRSAYLVVTIILGGWRSTLLKKTNKINRIYIIYIIILLIRYWSVIIEVKTIIKPWWEAILIGYHHSFVRSMNHPVKSKQQQSLRWRAEYSCPMLLSSMEILCNFQFYVSGISGLIRSMFAENELQTGHGETLQESISPGERKLYCGLELL